MAYNVLIVDDSAIVRTVVEKTLRVSGCALGEIWQAANGREALDQLKAHWVDIVFADINMPEMNGVEMVNRMAETGLLKTVPVVIVSSGQGYPRLPEQAVYSRGDQEDSRRGAGRQVIERGMP